MPEQTEAACLLVGGTSYRKRTLLHPKGGGDIFVGVRPGGFSAYRGDAPIIHYDFEGRWQRAFLDGVHYLKGLDTTVRSIHRVREGESLVLRRRTLPDADASLLDTRIRDEVADLLAMLDAGRFSASGRSHGGTPLSLAELGDLLRRSAGWDAPAWLGDRDRYRSTYGPLPFVPPTCPNPLILQAAVGPGFGRSSGERSRRRSVAEFEAHVEAVGRLVGRRLASCRDILLDGLDPLGRTLDESVGIVEAALRRFPLDPGHERPAGIDEEAGPLASIQATIDDFSGDLPDPQPWHRLRSLGLAHFTFGVESGDPAIRAGYGKRWDVDRLHRSLEAARGAEILGDMVILLGAGGVERADSHVEATLALIRSLPPSTIRRLYLVDARTFEAAPPGGSPLTDLATAEQAAALKRSLSGGTKAEGPAVIVYNGDKQPL